MSRLSGLLLAFTAVVCLLNPSDAVKMTRFKFHGKFDCDFRKDAIVHWIELWEADTPFGIGSYLDQHLQQNVTLNNKEWPNTYSMEAYDTGDGITSEYELYFKIMHSCTKSGRDYTSFRVLTDMGYDAPLTRDRTYDFEVNFDIREWPLFGRHRRFDYNETEQQGFRTYFH